MDQKNKIIDVTAAVIRRDGKYLIAKREKNDTFGGLWEFPGGKIESGESPEECLKRELKEELDIEVNVLGLLERHVHDYGHVVIDLMTYWVEYLSGDFVLNVHDEIAWVTVLEIDQYKFVPADYSIVEFIKNKI